MKDLTTLYSTVCSDDFPDKPIMISTVMIVKALFKEKTEDSLYKREKPFLNKEKPKDFE